METSTSYPRKEIGLRQHQYTNTPKHSDSNRHSVSMVLKKIVWRIAKFNLGKAP